MSHQELVVKKIIKYTLLFLIVGLMTMIFYLSLFKPGFRKINLFDLSDYPVGAWTWESPLYSYSEIEKLFIEKDTVSGKRLKAVIPFSEAFSGFGLDKKVSIAPNALLEIEWKAEGRAPYIQIDILEGREGVDDPGKGEIFSVIAKVPDEEWSVDYFSLSKFERNRHQEDFRPRDGEINFNNILETELTFAPGSDIRLYIRRAFFTWGVLKWDYIVLLALCFLTAVFFLSRHHFLPVYSQKKDEFYENRFLNRIILLFLSLALSLFTISIMDQYRHFSEYVLFGGILIFILIDEIKVHPLKNHPLWSYRYFSLYFLTWFLGGEFYYQVDFFIIQGCFIPLINHKDRKKIFVISVLLILMGFLKVYVSDNSNFPMNVIVIVFSILVSALLMEFFHYQKAKDETQEVSFLYETIFYNSSDGIYVLDENRNIKNVNQAFLNLIGYTRREVLDKPIISFVCEDDRKKMKNEKAYHKKTSRKIEVRFLNKNHCQYTVILLEDCIVRKGKLKGYQAIATDITERKMLELKLKSANEKLNRIAALDPLTRIPNRRSFDKFAGEVWAKSLKSKDYLAVILLDIDFFKKYNDHYGHQKGDDCLIEVASTIAGVTRKDSDLVARYGGEEFVALFPGLPPEVGLKMAERIVQSVEAKKIKHEYSSVSSFVTVSAGVYVLVPDEKASLKQALRLADSSLYKAKDRGKNRAVSANFS